MTDREFLGASLLLLGVAAIYLLTTSVTVSMAREGFLSWSDAYRAVDTLAIYATLGVGAVVFSHSTSRSRRPEKE